ncbi:MAG TPA: discoidin domain-containing protein [Candidatus Brocadiia bacterium]|nr:discoidin domain-containing protein [Candidatus Brocadiia bacterium]
MSAKTFGLTVCALLLSLASCAGSGARPAPISLAGEWEFRLDPNCVGARENWSAAAFGEKARLPGTTDENRKGAKNDKAEVSMLSRVYTYVGPAWYRREFVIPDEWRGRRVSLFLERCHWETRVWLDGAEVGMRDSLCAPHVYDLGEVAPGPHRLTIRVDNSIKYDVGRWAHSITDMTQTNWNGIVGRIELSAHDPVWIRSVQVHPNVKLRRVRAVIEIGNDLGRAVECDISAMAKPARTIDAEAGTAEAAMKSAAKRESIPAGGRIVELEVEMGEGVVLWDEFNPALYEIDVSLDSVRGGDFSDTRSVRFGMREFAAAGTRFTLNGRPTFVRGNLECCIFPMTGHPPTDVASWLRLCRIAKEYGLNHVRFHSWCPPEAAFEAADLAGVTFQIETPVWTALGADERTDGYIRAEADRILEAYGNHPSFCMLSVGNEPSGENQKKFLAGVVSEWKRKDGRRLYTGCSGWPEIPENQYHVLPGRRGPLRLHGGPLGPRTDFDYAASLAGCQVPVIAHELGQWCVYPNFEEIPKYAGVLRARNFETFRDSLAAHGMSDQARDFLAASGKLQVILYKSDIEAMLRTPGAGGFQLLQLHDFPGQGTALVGMLDAFWDSKGYVAPEEFRQFCCETVPLLRMKKMTWTTAERFEGTVEVCHFGAAPIMDAQPEWTITDSSGKQLAAGKLEKRAIPLGNGIGLGRIDFDLSAVPAPSELTVEVSIAGTQYRNDWRIWVYPAQVDVSIPEGVKVSPEFGEDEIAALKRGGRLLLLPRLSSPKHYAASSFEPIFWNMQWFPGQPRQLGVLCDPKHPALAEFPTRFHSDWQWFDLMSGARLAILDSFPAGFRPIVQVIDDWNTNRKLGAVFETRTGGGRLLVCSLDLENNLEKRPAARQLLRSLLRYAASDAFNPADEIELARIAEIMREPDLSAVSTDSAAGGYPGANAVDGDPKTIWHTPWEGTAPDYPHEIVIKMRDTKRIRGIRLLPRQDVANGFIKDFQVFARAGVDGWGEPVFSGSMQRGPAAQELLFPSPVAARYVRFVALSGHNDKFAAIAEIEIIPAE